MTLIPGLLELVHGEWPLSLSLSCWRVLLTRPRMENLNGRSSGASLPLRVGRPLQIPNALHHHLLGQSSDLVLQHF